MVAQIKRVKRKCLDGWIPVLVLAVLTCACSSEQKQVTISYKLPAELTLEAHALRGPEGDLYIVGTTNFPSGMKMWLYVGDGHLLLCDSCIDKNLADGDVRIHDSKFESRAIWEEIRNPYFTSKIARLPDGPKLKFRRRPVPGGRYKVRFTALFNSGWQSPDVVSILGGEGGKRLHGKMVKSLNSDVIDSSKELDYTVVVEVPPLTPETKAISLVKSSVLTVPGLGRSATDVEANIDLFISSTSVLAKSFHGETAKGMRPAKGWLARTKNGNTIEVIFDFMDGDAPKQAIWTVALDTSVVKYVNEDAKTLSWTPDS
jgi:hypothetical protein